jgi:MerR family transcriptional regulator, light-induced transcriptional regulator
MLSRSDSTANFLSISAVERETGLSKDTLRVWERRYGFPAPTRDCFGERLYSFEELCKLKAVCRLIDAGYRPGKIVKMSVDYLERLANQARAEGSGIDAQPTPCQELDLLFTLCKSHQVDALRSQLTISATNLGLARFITEIIAPLTRRIGEAWAKGTLEIFEEHLYTESVQVVLRAAIGDIQPLHESPKVLLTTFPIESHGLGLLMAEALMTLNGAKCCSLGVQTPIRDIAKASQSQGVDVVALSFSSYLNPNQVIDGLVELRQLLPPSIELWAGGLCSVLLRKPLEGVNVVSSLEQLPETLRIWRERQLG